MLDTNENEIIICTKITPNGRCSHLSDRGDRDIFEGETRLHVGMTSAKKFVILSPSPAPKNPAHNDCADSCLVSSNKLQLTRMNTVGCEPRLWNLKTVGSENFKRRALTAPLGENPTSRDSADWCLVPFCRVSVQSDKNCRLRIDSPPHRPWEEIEKSGPERLCGLMSSIILPRFSSIAL